MLREKDYCLILLVIVFLSILAKWNDVLRLFYIIKVKLGL